MTENGFCRRISAAPLYPLKYTDPDGNKPELVVSKKNGTLTATYTPDNTKSSDTSRFQDFSGGTTNPTQIANGTYSIVPAQASKRVNPGRLYKYGEPDNKGFLISVTQMLPDVERGELLADGGYMIHITPNSFTDGRIGIPYNKNEGWSRSAAQGKLNTLMLWYWVAKDRNETATITITD